jgi:hypothetical protein
VGRVIGFDFGSFGRGLLWSWRHIGSFHVGGDQPKKWGSQDLWRVVFVALGGILFPPCFNLSSLDSVLVLAEFAVSVLAAMDDMNMSFGLLGLMDEESENHGSTNFGQHY